MSAKKSPSAKNRSQAAGRSSHPPASRSKPPARKRTVSKKPAASADAADPAAPRRVRLQRALAAAGFGSRRQCEELILEGRVEVDGQIVDQLGTTIDPSASKVFVDGTPLKPRRLVYYAVNKPVGVVTTNADPEGRPRVIDLVPPDERVFPVGRLDRSSEGLILLTNDGDLAQHLAHPRYEVQKVYRVTVAGSVQPETIRQMQQGIYIAEGLVRVEGARVLKAKSRATEMEITLREGKNREIRRILARLGHKVQTLKRIAIGPLRLGEMPTGAYRKLTFEEIRKLKTPPPIDRGTGDEASERRPRSAAPGKRRTAAPSGRPARSGKPVVERQASSAPRTAAGDRSGGRPVRSRGDQSQSLAVEGLPELSGPRGGVVIGADPVVKSDAPKTPRTKDHIVQPRPKRAAGGSGKPAARGRSGKPPATGKRSTTRSANSGAANPGAARLGKGRPAARRKKGS